MCGIAGEISSKHHCNHISENLKAMVQSMNHRGPDEQRYYQEDVSGKGFCYQVNLGMCRLSIIDREHGQQPFGDSCKAFFNGEIYNHKDLRSGWNLQCKTNCDSEVIAKMYQLHGADFVRKLDGMFSIAIWDEPDKLLCLFRDRIGKKPLYYYHGDNVFLFASEIKAILTHPAYEKKMNKAGIFQYLALQYVPEPETAFEGIKQVPPGNWVIYNPQVDDIAHGSYHDFIPPAETKMKSMVEVENIVREAVYKRLESEVPLGVYLSGGIDSAIVTEIASRRVEELHTFTMGFLEPEYDETADAEILANLCGTQHHVERVTSVNLANMAKQIVEQYDQPFGDCSAIPTILLSELSKKYITVALTGDGGDEAFGGYPRYWQCQNKLYDYPKYMTVIPWEYLVKLWPDPPHYSDPINYIEKEMYQRNANDLMYCDLKTYLLNDIIVKMERATMLSSVEARCPFLDKDVLELGLTIPPEQKIGKDSGKLILKEAFKDYLPDRILGLKKRGFGVPMDKWLRQTEGVLLMAQTIMAKDAFGPLEEIDRQFVNIMISEHLSGKNRHGHRLWILIMLDMWLRRNF